ncbi:hypothetical protein ASE25_04430 [Terrabacter sp. Root85]|uniref:hypothetical protein n=1 Tax=Terrabacter sp. Root85 TaxID=1736603 RepID=UPI0007020E6A|nr:hypothetical protein [Terrabacter sp. Root85]KRC92578.1 hypothetical protein ASE25_04430 [Terrabacter sp. Root85]
MTTTPQDALAVTTALAPHGGYRSPFAALARIEAWRFARHPMFLVGTALGVVFTAMALNEQAHQVTSDSLSLPVVALTVGVASMITAYHLTRSFHRAGELLEASPTSVTTRTAALCLMAGVPALVASAWLVLYYAIGPSALSAPEWMYGPFSPAAVATVLVQNSIACSVGGTLLGVAAGRWWRFRGASAVLVLAVVVWTFGVLGVFTNTESAPAEWYRWVRLFEPLGIFTNAAQGYVAVTSLTGSPAWYLAWTLTLCGLAALAALLWRSEGRTRRRLVRIGVVLVALSVLTYGLASAGGLSEPVRSYPDGHSVVLVSK